MTTIEWIRCLERDLDVAFKKRLIGLLRLQNILHEDNEEFFKELARSLGVNGDKFCQAVWLWIYAEELANPEYATTPDLQEAASHLDTSVRELESYLSGYARSCCALPSQCNDPLIDPPSNTVFPWDDPADILADLQADAGIPG